MTKGIISIIFCLITSYFTQAQIAFSIKQAQEHALNNNYDIKNAQLDVEHASKKMQETLSVGLPQINADIEWQNFIEVPTTLVPASQFNPEAPDNIYTEMQFGIPHSTNASITASQLIFNGSYLVGLKAAKYFMKFAETRKNLTENQIKDSVATAYFNVLIAKENSDFIESIVRIHKDIVEEIQEKYLNGFVEDLEVDRISLILSQMEMQYANTQRQTEIAEAYLKLIIGTPLEDEIILSDSLEQLLNASVNFKLEEAQIENRLEYKMADMKIRLKELDMRRYQSNHLPTVSAFASIGRNAMGVDFNAFEQDVNWYPSQLVGVKISLPIFDGLGGMAKTQQARLIYEQAKNDKNQITANLKLAFLASQSNYLNAISNYNHEQNNVILSKKIYDKTLEKYREGLVSSIELSEAGNDYIETSTNLSQSIYNLLINNLNYQRCLGK